MKKKNALYLSAILALGMFAAANLPRNPSEKPLFVDSDNIALAETVGQCYEQINWSCWVPLPPPLIGYVWEKHRYVPM